MPPPSVKELLARSNLAFTGTVEDVEATTVVDVPVNARTVVVQVSEVLHAPSEVGLEPGSRVTVQLADDLPTLPSGATATFFANGLAYGEELAVAEVGRSTADQAAAPTARLPGLQQAVSPVRAALAELAEEEVVDHAREAEAVVRAQVIALTMVAPTGPPREHDPQYWIATLLVDVVAKGEVSAGDSVAVLYANSLDVRVRRRPKPKAGQGGLWLLHRTGEPELAALAPFELVHPLDLQDSIVLDVLREHGI
jgi:hypothetical protein